MTRLSKYMPLIVAAVLVFMWTHFFLATDHSSVRVFTTAWASFGILLLLAVHTLVTRLIHNLGTRHRAQKSQDDRPEPPASGT